MQIGLASIPTSSQVKSQQVCHNSNKFDNKFTSNINTKGSYNSPTRPISQKSLKDQSRVNFKLTISMEMHNLEHAWKMTAISRVLYGTCDYYSCPTPQVFYDELFVSLRRLHSTSVYSRVLICLISGFLCDRAEPQTIFTPTPFLTWKLDKCHYKMGLEKD